MYLNRVYLDPHSAPVRQLRVVLEQIDFLMLIDINDDTAWPFRIEASQIDSLGLELIADPIELIDTEPNSKAEKARDRAYSAIEPLLENNIELFDKGLRNKHIKVLLQSTDEKRLYVTRQLRRYWQRGMTPNSLAPDYTNCGSPGEVRRSVTSKLGRKRTVTPGTGMVITEEIAGFFRLSIEGFYLLRDDIDLPKARTKAISYIKSKYPKIPASDMPTDMQFRYFFEKHYSKPDVIKARTSNIEYEKDIAPLVSTSVTNNFGPGARYEIDATIADVYLVSALDPDRIVGRPVIYKVKDVFSRMTVGLYVGLENPSWATASIALANAFCDKVDYCRRFGVEISYADWPSVGTPATVTADRGELLGKHGDILVNRFGITLSNTRAYHGDDKGIVERSFKTMHVDILPYVQGKVEPINGKKKAGKRNELYANLTLYDFTRIVIMSEVNRNVTGVLKGYDFEPDMPTDLAPIPVDLWNWGVRNRTGVLREVDKTLTYINFLPHEKATVSVLGICFKGMYYTCPEAVSLGWFHKNKAASRPRSVQVAYDPLDTSSIYIRPENKFDSVWKCTLESRSRRYKDMSFTEAVSIQKESRTTIAGSKQNADYKAPDLQKEIELITLQAAKRKKGADLSIKSERLKGIRDKRQQEKEIERQKNRELVQPPKSQERATVTPISTEIESDFSFDFPDLDDF